MSEQSERRERGLIIAAKTKLTQSGFPQAVVAIVI